MCVCIAHFSVTADKYWDVVVNREEKSAKSVMGKIIWIESRHYTVGRTVVARHPRLQAFLFIKFFRTETTLKKMYI